MKRYIRLCLLTVMTLGFFAFSSVNSQAQDLVLQGTLPADEVRVLLKGNNYRVYLEYVIEGTLIIEPGAEVQFQDNSRFIVAAGGRLIADGFATLARGTYPTNVTTTYQEHGYADMRVFLFGNLATLKAEGMGRRERTIHPTKYNHIFNVAVDTVNRRLVNIRDPYDGAWVGNDDASANGVYTAHYYRTKADNRNLVIVPFETAIMFMAARMPEYTSTNVALKLNEWARSNGTSVNITPAPIKFYGQPQLQHSREWGHIVVLPGARAAFFRNCEFEHFKKTQQ